MGVSVLEAVNHFCYLGDTLSAAGGCDAAAIARCKCAGESFMNFFLYSLLHICLSRPGGICIAVVRNLMLHAVETWPKPFKALQRVRGNDLALVRWICQFKSTDASMDDLHAKLGLCDIAV